MIKTFFLTLVSVNAEYNDGKTSLILTLILKHKLVCITREVRITFKMVLTTG